MKLQFIDIVTPGFQPEFVLSCNFRYFLGLGRLK